MADSTNIQGTYPDGSPFKFSLDGLATQNQLERLIKLTATMAKRDGKNTPDEKERIELLEKGNKQYKQYNKNLDEATDGMDSFESSLQKASTVTSLFKGHMFYANTRTKHSSTFNLLQTTGFASGSSNLIVSNGTTTNTYTFQGAKQVTDIVVTSAATTTTGDYFLLNSAENQRNSYHQNKSKHIKTINFYNLTVLLNNSSIKTLAPFPQDLGESQMVVANLSPNPPPSLPQQSDL